uniref:Cell division cycle-associated protein 7 n=1 Tax=Lygus hesperus TaxID=30085 RepID=A0A0A9X0U1_LYGHE
MPVEDNSDYSSDSAEYATDDETSLYERRILKLKRRRARAFFEEFKDGEIVKVSELLPKKANPSPPTSPVKIRKRSYKKKFYTPLVALQPRKSTRLSSKTVDYEGLDDDFREPPVYRKRNIEVRTRTRRSLEPREVDFNPDALSGVVCYSSQKVYSQSGTTCHQCRQKTIDLKSRCYSPYCRGVRGMFCGNCLLKRYGERVDDVLRDPNWNCPPCRKICNCSICRRSYGKDPTGQLFPSVSEKGYNNVLEYLAKIGDDKLEDGDDADDESEDENTPPVKKAKISNDDLEPIVLLERINLSFDETGNVITDFKGFS